MYLEYNQKLSTRARQLRKRSTLSEILLWNQLKMKKLGYQFFRQKPIGNYIVDFYCQRLNLVIEIDGSSHKSKPDYDQFRDEYFNLIGLHIIRFTDKEVIGNMSSVLKIIKDHIGLLSKTTSETLSPL